MKDPLSCYLINLPDIKYCFLYLRVVKRVLPKQIFFDTVSIPITNLYPFLHTLPYIHGPATCDGHTYSVGPLH